MRSRGLAAIFGAGLLVAGVILTGCGTTSAGPPYPQSAWPVVRATVDGRAVSLIVAEDHHLGMRNVADLGPVHGMLFAYPKRVDPTAVSFTMRGLAADLDAFFFDAEGLLIEAIRMPACAAEPCPTYGPDRPFRWVIESPAASLDVPDGARLDVDPATAGPSSGPLTTTAAGA